MPQYKLRKMAISIAMFAVVAFGSAAAARADDVTFNLDRGSTLPNQLYGTISLHLNGSGQIEFTVALINGAYIIETGQNTAIGFSSSLATSPTISSSLFSNAGYSLNATTAGDNDADGFGSYEYAIRSIYGANDGALAASNLTFTITCTSCAGGMFSSVFDLVANGTHPPGSIDSPFAIDIFCPNCSGGQTGFIGTTGTQPIPEPAGILLLGTGLVGFAAGLRKRFKK